MRQLEREIGSVVRKVARQVAEGTLKRKVSITEPRVRELLGKRKFYSEARRRTSRPGVATGLAWTPVGGEVLFVEATAMPGSGQLTITGQLGDVMRESAQAARSYVRANAPELFPDLPDDWFATHDIHIHVPGRGDPQGRAERRRDDGDRARLAALGPAGALRRGHDRRGDAHRPGAADRRPQGEGARGAAQRHPHRHRPGAQRARHRRDPRASAKVPASVGRYSSGLSKLVSRVRLRGVGASSTYAGSVAGRLLAVRRHRAVRERRVRGRVDRGEFAPTVRGLCGQPAASMVPAGVVGRLGRARR